MEALRKIIHDYETSLMESTDLMRENRDDGEENDASYYEGKRDAYNQILVTLRQLFGFL